MPDINKKEIVLVLGGARSGKSTWALNHVQDHYDAYLFMATAEVNDREMAKRVRLHQAARGEKWRLIEEPLRLDQALENNCRHVDAVLVDCLTVWLSNVLLKEGKAAVRPYVEGLLDAVSNAAPSVVLVSNEVGSGIVPEHALGRDFRDLAGLLNRKMAALSDRVVLTVAGLPLYLK